MSNTRKALSLLILLAAAGCGPAADSIPSAQAEQEIGSPTYSRAHAAIPASAADELVYEYY